MVMSECPYGNVNVGVSLWKCQCQSVTMEMSVSESHYGNVIVLCINVVTSTEYP